MGSLQEPEGFKRFLHEPQGANGEGRAGGEEGSSTGPCISSDPPHLAFLGPELCLEARRSRTQGRRRKQGGRTGHRKPFAAPVPSLQAKAEPYLAAARRSLQQAGRLGELRSAGNMNLPPATNLMENKRSPCRAEQLGLGMWARSRPGLRRGERGRIGGVPAPQSPFELPSAGGMKQDLRLPKRVVHSSSCSPHRRLPFPEPPSSKLLDTSSWIIKSRLGRGRREGRARSWEEPSGLCCSLPLSQALCTPCPEKEEEEAAWLWAAAMAAAVRRKAAPGRGAPNPCLQPRSHSGFCRFALSRPEGMSFYTRTRGQPSLGFAL